MQDNEREDFETSKDVLLNNAGNSDDKKKKKSERR